MEQVGGYVRVTRVRRFEPQTVDDITQNRNGNRRIVRVDSLDELRGLGKVCVPRKFHAKERMSLVTREVHILYPLGYQLY